MLSGIRYESVILPPSIRRIALLSDTHTTIRSPALHPNLLEIVDAMHPDVIFHAGDICLPSTIQSLEAIAPVIAVRGNRDLTRLNHLPEACIISLNQHRILLTHGHAPLDHYLIDKLHYMRLGFKFTRYYAYLNAFDTQAQLYLFGHTHVAFHHRVGLKQYINPGAACRPNPHDPYPSLVQLDVSDQDIKPVFISL